jgi:hypothetical protein
MKDLTLFLSSMEEGENNFTLGKTDMNLFQKDKFLCSAETAGFKLV